MDVHGSELFCKSMDIMFHNIGLFVRSALEHVSLRLPKMCI